jgi:hypothetical protein
MRVLTARTVLETFSTPAGRKGCHSRMNDGWNAGITMVPGVPELLLMP